MHLVTGEETNHQMSCHLVRVEPNCNLDTHIHGENLEIHEVIAGTGICYLENNKYEYAQGTISGDVLFNRSIGRTDLPGGSHQTLLKNIREKLFVLPDETVVYSGHGPATTIGEEKKDNPFLS